MPTGYTAPVQEGKITFPEFVWRCARAFGALVHMRDDPMDAPIRESSESQYYSARHGEITARIAELETMAPAELEAHVAELRARITRENAAYVEKNRVERKRYDNMLAQVRAWAPPDSHAELKKFMLEQLAESIRFDCGEPYQVEVPVNPGDWRDKELVQLRSELARCQEYIDRDAARAKERNDWVRTLASSVPIPESLKPQEPTP